jgi:hypothetical protein
VSYLHHPSGIDFDDEEFGFEEEEKSNIKVSSLFLFTLSALIRLTA